jgi:hypothetical protein
VLNIHIVALLQTCTLLIFTAIVDIIIVLRSYIICDITSNILYATQSLPTFRKNISSTFLGLTNKPYMKPSWSRQQAYLTYSSNLIMDPTSSSEMCVDFHWPTRRYVPEEGSLHNLKSYNNCIAFNWVLTRSLWNFVSHLLPYHALTQRVWP